MGSELTLDRALLTVEEAARFLRIGRSAAYEGVRAGQIPAIRIGRSIRVPTAKLLQMVGIATPCSGTKPPTPQEGTAVLSHDRLDDSYSHQ
jgi:excisionase family DNA binding protein